VILWTLDDGNDDGDRAVLVLFAHVLHLGIDVAVVVIVLTNAVHVLLQLHLIEPS
jgi:hypothetical protein